MWSSACLVHFAMIMALFSTICEASHDEIVKPMRHLQQRDEEVAVTSQNIRSFDKRVAEAQRGDVFVFVEDVHLLTVIEVATPGLTFRGDPRTRPTLTCADEEGGFLIHASKVEVKNLILQNCTKSAIRVFDKGSICEDPFDPSCQKSSPQRLDIILTKVDFINNVGTEAVGTGGGGGFMANELVHAKILNCRFERNVGIRGGAIFFSGSSLFIENSTFIANVAKNTGGAIYAIQSEMIEVEETSPRPRLTIMNTRFEENSVLNGGRDRSELTLANGIALENNPYISFPLPSPSGGAIYVADHEEVHIEQCKFARNHAVPAGGAIHLSDNVQIIVLDCDFDGNYVEPPENANDPMDLQLGGGIFIAHSETSSLISIEKCRFNNNSAVYGGALHYVGPIEEAFGVNECQFTHNKATVGGGAIVFRNVAVPTIEFTLFESNSAFAGGAIFVTNGGGLLLPEGVADSRATRFINNVAYDGGAVFGVGSKTIAIRRIFYKENKAKRNGGAICLVDSKAGSNLQLSDARMHNNSAESGGAMYLESISSVYIVGGASDRNAMIFTGYEDPPRNEFFGNTAVSGGAIYYKATNVIQNNFRLNVGIFSGNAVHSNLSSVFPEPLNHPAAVHLSTRDWLEAVERDDMAIASESGVLDPMDAYPCHPGGGGAMCMVLSGISDRAPASIKISESSFTRNSAVVGGAMMISTKKNINWTSDCPPSRRQTATFLMSDPCRNLNLRALTFEKNKAQAAGGALMVSNLKHVYYSNVAENDRDYNYQTLDAVKERDDFIENHVGKDGYGKDIAGTVARLNIHRPKADVATGVLIANQSGGRAHPLPPIEIQVLDGLDQVISDGIVDSVLSVHVTAVSPDNNGSIAAGQVVSTASKGAAIFNALTLNAFPGQYEIVFSVRGSNVKAVGANVILRECRLGERYDSDGFFCEACPFESFAFHMNATHCAECPDKARCSGSASMIPASGYWHSSPFSVIMHECLHDDACAYKNRQTDLETIRGAQIQEFLDRFDQQDTPVFTNQEYPQCSTGYDGPLCGSCAPGYGQADGKTCVRCNSDSVTIAVISLLALWQLLLLALMIRSALASIRDMNQMMIYLQNQAAATDTPAHARAPQKPFSAVTMSSRSKSTAEKAISQRRLSLDTDGSEIEDEEQLTQSLRTVPASAFVSPIPCPAQLSPNDEHTADSIIAAQHTRETIKILVNFLQVTSIAVDINLEWTDSIKNVLIGMHSVAGFSTGAAFTPMACLFDPDSDTRSIHALTIRILLVMFYAFLFMLFFLVRWLIVRRNPNTIPLSCRQFLKSRLNICVLVVTLLTYQSVSRDFMATLSCIQLDSKDMSEAEEFDDPSTNVSYSYFSTANSRYWTEDTDIKCDSRSLTLLGSIAGIPGILLFLSGIPLTLLIFLLYKRRRNQLMEFNVLNTYGFIYENYEEKFVYWEVCILFRKALISAIVVFAYRMGANLQGAVALGVLILALVIHLIASPFKFLSLNILEGCSLIVSIFTFYTGVLFSDANTADSAKVLLSVILIVVHGLFVMAALFTIFVYVDKSIVAKLKLLAVTDISPTPISRMIQLACVLQQRMKANATVAVHQTFPTSSPPETERDESPETV